MEELKLMANNLGTGEKSVKNEQRTNASLLPLIPTFHLSQKA
jgi:hypothetical protein